MSNAITWFQDQVIQPICSDLQVPYAFTTESVGIGTGAPVVSEGRFPFGGLVAGGLSVECISADLADESLHRGVLRLSQPRGGKSTTGHGEHCTGRDKNGRNASSGSELRAEPHGI